MSWIKTEFFHFQFLKKKKMKYFIAHSFLLFYCLISTMNYARSAKQVMRASIVHAYKTPLKVQIIDKPIPKSGELLVKIKTSGCCHTDLHAIEGDW